MAFPVKAGETGKLYGSITTAMIAEAAEQETGATLDKRQIDCEPIKSLGVHKAAVRLTIDLVPEITILVHREGEPAEFGVRGGRTRCGRARPSPTWRPRQRSRREAKTKERPKPSIGAEAPVMEAEAAAPQEAPEEAEGA